MNFSNVLDLVCVLLHELACKSIWFFQLSFYEKTRCSHKLCMNVVQCDLEAGVDTSFFPNF